MAEIAVTPAQQIRLNLLATLNYDTAAAADAIKFVGDDPLKYQVFVNQLSRVTSESGLGKNDESHQRDGRSTAAV
jgi:hypothetical protein